MKLFARSLAHGERIDVDGLALSLRVNPRARRVSLRIDARTGEAVATAPSARRLADAVAFARARRAWLAERLAARSDARPLASDGRIAVLGEAWRLVPDGRRPRLEAGVLRGCGAGSIDGQLVIRAIRQAALERYDERAAAHCAGLNVAAPTVAISDPRSRWGSCTPPARGRRGSIRLSWRLALAPFEVADYVVAHECAHLIEANHGPRFWTLVRTLVGDPGPHRAFLRRHGPALHAFGHGSVL
ncbi:MAG: M48 family metallopeptidase [Caulobacteraceae bacterium]